MPARNDRIYTSLRISKGMSVGDEAICWFVAVTKAVLWYEQFASSCLLAMTRGEEKRWGEAIAWFVAVAEHLRHCESARVKALGMKKSVGLVQWQNTYVIANL